ncbi:hypothetical protein KR222_002175, partial [Zaprionus bogoriensis]
YKMEEASTSVGDLEKKLNSAKQSLITLNDNIRRFVGRGIKDSRFLLILLKQQRENVQILLLYYCRMDKYSPDGGIKRNEQNFDRINQRQDFLKQKRRVYDSKIVVNRLPKEEEESLWLPSPRINSRVIREMPSREEIVEAQGMDSESRARNRRMFGSLLGTLQKFCQEESRLKKKENKKALIEKKLEEQELQEKTLIQKERESLFLDRKRKQIEIRSLEKKVARLKDYKTWENSMISQQNQIRTRTKPHLFFQPRLHSPQTEKLVLESKKEIDCILKKRREDLQVELREIECSVEEDCAMDDNTVFDNSTSKEFHRANLMPE